ncbi:MAG: CpsD/CapB family tyrosine-protein kinase [Tabrizicola sp.]|nr:CpsD/CapB family tyrosine-protein kinase [Tabrizicola sp.]
MERLHAAIEKARSQRQETQGKVMVTRATSRIIPRSELILNKAWDMLRMMEMRPAHMQKHRLAAFGGGHHAAPYDLLRTRILQQANKNNWRRIAIVSPHSECGKTTTVANLIFSFGRQRDLRTLALDFDLRRAGLGKVLGQTLVHSMGEVLERRVPFSAHGLRFGLNVAIGLNSGPVRNPSELLQSVQTIEVLEELEATYLPEIVLFDMPPLLSSDDNYGFLRNVDAALIMAEAERTTIAQIDLAERQVSELTSVMGIVLNKCRYPDESYAAETAAS